MAENPKNLRYTKDHEWARRDGGAVVVGITAHAQEALGAGSVGSALLALQHGLDEGRFILGSGLLEALYVFVAVLVGITVTLCVLRGVPVLWDSRDLLLRRMLPRTPD